MAASFWGRTGKGTYLVAFKVINNYFGAGWSQLGIPNNPTQVQLQRRVFRPVMAMTRSAFVILFVLAASMVVNTQGQVPIAPAPSPANASAPYYISYGALSANQAPCPAGTGRSYYSANCTAQTGATPYTRSCDQITRCARG